MTRSLALSLTLALGLAVAPAAQADAADPRARLKQQLGAPTPLMDDLAELCDHIGGRITGSPAAARAVTWATDKLRALGYAGAHAEPYTLPYLWLPGTVELSATAPEAFTLAAVAAPGTGSTAAPREAALLDVGEGTAADFARLGARAAGAFVLVRSREMKTFDDLFDEYMRSAALMESATKARVAGLLLQSTRPRALLYQHPTVFGRTPSPLPVVLVAREHAQRLLRLGEHGPVRVKLHVVNHVGGAVEANNVVAELRGRERPDEVVLLGAHLDSWSLGTGAEDNGVNVALVLDVARAFHALGRAPRRTVRFALFTGEEQGLWGSNGYVERHRAELPKHAAVIIFDIGSGHTTGFYVSGRPELRAPVAKALSPFPGLGPKAHPLDGIDGTDNFSFLLSGVPNLVAAQDPLPYLPDYHATSDVLERVNVREAKRNAALAAVLAWGLADTTEPLPRQQTRAEIEKLLTQYKLVEQMKAFDQWDDWRAGKLGFPADAH